MTAAGPRPVGRWRATTAAGRAAPAVGATPERRAKGPMLAPLDVLLRAGLIDQDQHRAALEFGRLRRMAFAGAAPQLASRSNVGGGGRALGDAEVEAIERRYLAGRRALGEPRIVRLIERVVVDQRPIASGDLASLRVGLARLVSAFAGSANRHD